MWSEIIDDVIKPSIIRFTLKLIFWYFFNVRQNSAILFFEQKIALKLGETQNNLG